VLYPAELPGRRRDSSRSRSNCNFHQYQSECNTAFAALLALDLPSSARRQRIICASISNLSATGFFQRPDQIIITSCKALLFEC